MPTDYVRKLADEHHMSVGDAEKKWAEAKKLAAKEGKGDNYAYITGVFKKLMGEKSMTQTQALARLRVTAADGDPPLGGGVINALAGRVFAARDVAHRIHWGTSSYAQHVALDEFYNKVIEAIDAVVECYQGEFGIIGDFAVRVPAVQDVAVYLRDEMNWIKGNREAISSGSESVLNLVDELISVYQKAIYKLTNLS